MREERIAKFSKMSIEEIKNLKCYDFTVSELEEIILETPLTEQNRNIARLRYKDRMTYEQISETLGIDKKTCINRLNKISNELKKTLIKLLNN